MKKFKALMVVAALLALFFVSCKNNADTNRPVVQDQQIISVAARDGTCVLYYGASEIPNGWYGPLVDGYNLKCVTHHWNVHPTHSGSYICGD